ncbi:putative hydroxypyruvate isomerase [Trachemys scripta elegans]|uniref:putative hydroxypyruvate isomerase n=1 Tax=Trachemys scripta elegans TaxID=31138 RepID=UPI0015556A6D|nr:putative hydroxypyruvate isomerase [Trachemys scripta elegans]
MAPLRFAANLAWLFPERPALPERLEAAARAGFPAAELPEPYAWCPALLRGAADRAGLALVLINTPPGDEDKGEKGLGAVPGRQAAFREGLALAVKYAKVLGCPRIHLMAGRVPVGTERAAMALEMETTFVENLRYAADILAQEDMTGLLEPMNSRITDPRYFLTTPHQAAAILEKVGRPNLRLQLDIFHCQIMDGNLTQNLKTYFPLIGHIQVGQVPGRHEPDSPGEVNFPYLFQLLESLGYEGYVGCEYTPQGDTLEGLGWLHAYWESRGRQQRRC